MSLKNVDTALDNAEEKITAARQQAERLTDSAVADALALTLGAIDELHNAVIELSAEIEEDKP